MHSEVVKIPEQNFAKFNQAFEKLNKRCKKITGLTLSKMVIGKDFQKDEFGRTAVSIEVYVSVEEHFNIEGWEFIAKIDHRGGDHNVVFAKPNNNVPKEYFTRCYCDHCNENRKRNITYLLTDAEGNMKQVGSTCLKDFIGHDPVKIIKAFEFLTKARNTARDWIEYDGGWGFNGYEYVDLVLYTSSVINEIKKHGWLGSGQARDEGRDTAATYWQAFLNLNNSFEAEAIELINETKELEGRTNLELNLNSIAHNPYVHMKQLALAALIGRKWLKKNDQVKVESQHFLNVGDVFEGEVTVVDKKHIETVYGSTKLIKMQYNGNIVITFASGQFNPTVNDVITVKGRVKNNSVYNNVKQTVLNRVRVV